MSGRSAWAWECYGYHMNTQVADLCVANDDHTSLEYRTAGSGSGGLGGRQQDTKVALYGLVSLFKVREGSNHGNLPVVCVFTMQQYVGMST